MSISIGLPPSSGNCRISPAIKQLLFVEGESEEAFLKKLRESHIYPFPYLAVEVYGGCGNRRLKRIQMLLERCVKQGYTILIQGDADGRDPEIFRNLCQMGAIAEDHSFVFRHEFESAIPPEILYQALRKLERLKNVDYADFEKVVTTRDASVLKVLSDKFGIDVNPLKLRLAEAVGEIVNRQLLTFWHNDEIMATELGRFLKFIMHVS